MITNISRIIEDMMINISRLIKGTTYVHTSCDFVWGGGVGGGVSVCVNVSEYVREGGVGGYKCKWGWEGVLMCVCECKWDNEGVIWLAVTIKIQSKKWYNIRILETTIQQELLELKP